MIALLLQWAIVGLGSGVAIAAACRVNKVRLQDHRAGWVFSYALAGVWAAMEIHDALQVEARWSALFGLGSVALWIWGSRFTWRDGAPPWLSRRAPPSSHSRESGNPGVVPKSHRWPGSQPVQGDE